MTTTIRSLEATVEKVQDYPRDHRRRPDHPALVIDEQIILAERVHPTALRQLLTAAAHTHP